MVPSSRDDAPPDKTAEPEPEQVDDALDLLFAGKVETVLPPEEVGEFHDFLRAEALRRRRFAVSFRLDCGCLAWIGYALSNIVTHDEGMEFKARPTQTYIPDHEAEVEHPEGPTEDPPEEFADWPIWPFEIYQDELEGSGGQGDDASTSGLDETLEELAEELYEEDDLAPTRDRAGHEDPLVDDAD